MKKILIPMILSFVALVFLFSYQAGQLSDRVLTIVFCDVGQGDAIYIRTPGSIDILVDGGPAFAKASAGKPDKLNAPVLDCLSENMPLMDREIELVFATHPDADHIAGLVDVIESYTVKSFNTVAAEKKTKIFETLKKTIQEKKVPYQEIRAGSKFTLSDGVTIETKWPAYAQGFGGQAKDTNEYSLVQILTFEDFDLLLTGDVTFEILNGLDFSSNSIEVFKLPHHGSKTGVDNSTFQKIKASLAIISAGRNNSYYHPHPSVLNMLRKYNIEYKRTDIEGQIKIVTDGKTTKVVN
ncbi:MAG: MBL fold metallo-hydrolase [Candidatus Levybacteria bacterium]|nr:MBL fold metallo-hydrolase [Candidatus Levybacteria bacterium]